MAGFRDLQRIAADRRQLENELRDAVRGDVRFDAGYRAAYSTDSSNYRQAPLGVVCPLDADDVVAAMRTCRRLGAPMTFRGAATSLAGQTTNRPCGRARAPARLGGLRATRSPRRGRAPTGFRSRPTPPRTPTRRSGA